ncbi:MAG TPA: TraM recognition domain-containing protein [Ktedonobacteraceae bacterium]
MTFLRLATIAAHYGMQVIFLDLKGSKKTAAQFVATMRLIPMRRIAVYPQQAYDGWRGDATALYNRLMAMIDPGTHPYYRRITSALVSLAVHAPGGPPRSSQEFLARLDEKWLKYAYAGKVHWYAQRKINKLSEHISETSLTYDGFFDGVAGGLDGAFAYEDAVYIGLDGDALKEQAVNMARYLLEDAAHYAKHRKAPGVRTLCIIDEFGALGISNVTELYEHMREAGLSMWASAQSYQGLGSERDSLLAASSIKILHRCGDPKELVKYAGQREAPAFSQTLDNEGDTPRPSAESAPRPEKRTTVQMQRRYAVPLEDVQQLALGTIALISGGLHAWVQVYPVVLPEDVLRIATAVVSAPPEEPPSPIVPPPLASARKKTPRQTPPPADGEDQSQEAKEPSPASVPPPSPPQAPRPRPTAEEDDSPVDF